MTGKKEEKKKALTLTHARHDPMHCLTPGLFRSLKKGDRKRLKLDVAYDYGNGNRIEFKGHEPLGADDLRILQGLVAMAGPDGKRIRPEPQTDVGVVLRKGLKLEWEAVEEDAIGIETSFGALAREIGYQEGGDQYHAIRQCIERLWTVSIIVQKGRKRQGFHLLSRYASDETTGKIRIALNPLIARAVTGGRKHTRISLGEVRALKADPARLIHQRLCGWIDPGKMGRVELNTLCGYVWPEESDKPSTIRKRKMVVRRALEELEGLGWGIQEYASEKYTISRGGCDNGNERV